MKLEYIIGIGILIFLSIILYNLFKAENKGKVKDNYIDIKFPTENIDLKFENDNNIIDTIKYCINKEIKLKKLVIDFITNKDIKNNIIDCGAYYGDNSLSWAKIYKGIVYAFEPSLNKCNYIERTSKINNINNLKIINYGLSDKEEIINIIDPNNHNNNYIGIKNANYDSNIKEKFVQLDQLYNNKTVEKVDFMHFDVEGYEDKVLIGSKKIINDLKPIITVEIHPHYPDMGDSVSVLKILNEMEYKCYIIDEICGDINTCRNILCIHKNRKLNTDISNLIEVNYQNVNNLIKK
jgi:FkbM family methyltransferase